MLQGAAPEWNKNTREKGDAIWELFQQEQTASLLPVLTAQCCKMSSPQEGEIWAQLLLLSEQMHVHIPLLSGVNQALRHCRQNFGTGEILRIAGTRILSHKHSDHCFLTAFFVSGLVCGGTTLTGPTEGNLSYLSIPTDSAPYTRHAREHFCMDFTESLAKWPAVKCRKCLDPFCH